jgi:putative addiction module component (TIGR02574 family)
VDFFVNLWTDEDGVWIAECLALPGCVSQGATRDEAIANVREAIEACLEVFAERSVRRPAELVDVSVDVTVADIDFARVSHGIEVAQSLWDGMDPDRENWPLTPEMRALLDERIADHERNPDAGEPWEVVMERIRIDRRNRE